MRTLRKALCHRLVLKKVHKVLQFLKGLLKTIHLYEYSSKTKTKDDLKKKLFPANE